ncbi:C-type lectin 1-like isoform X2 [Sphaerodactylus townsendi]|uniref:C-type lectin 1-like isoform X2 n=1 Tax=Sphaerodactylus townsendi TaxID=933632 RepID=UPI00202679C5|nr:C-type lectin 1-like isoform X2 [Sphaerodactylus townsendi]
MSFSACLLLCLLGSLLSSSWAQEGAQNGTKPEARAQCRPGNFYYKQYCYQLFYNYVSWDLAEVVCQGQSGPETYLASLLSASEGRIVSTYLSRKGATDVWIGLRTTSSNGYMVWEWSDATPLSLPLWDGHNLNTAVSSNDCISMANIWNTISRKSQQRSCTDALPFLCKYQAGY